jgi:hypothetical protein
LSWCKLIIFLLGWPLEWSEILIIFVPIFLPMLDNFGINPYFFAMLVALNLQTSFLTPPMAMSAYYLKGVLKDQIELLEIFKGILPYLAIVIFSMVLLLSVSGNCLVAAGLSLWRVHPIVSESTQTVAETVEAIAEGRLTARQWTEHCLSQIDSPETIGTWSFIDRERHFSAPMPWIG